MKLIKLDENTVGYLADPDVGGHRNPVAVRPAGSYSADARVCEVRMKSGAVHTFGGELLTQALQNGARIIREIQKGKAQ